MNGRSLLAFICILFVIGILWMIVAIPRGEVSKTGVKLFQPVSPIPKGVAVASKSTEPSEQKETKPAEPEAPTPSEMKEPPAGKPKPEPSESASDEPPELVEYTPPYGRVAFTHMKHMEDY